MSNEEASSTGNENYRIVDTQDITIGHITRPQYMPVQILIEEKRDDFEWIATYLNERIFEKKTIAGPNGVCLVITEDFDSKEQSVLFTKIASMSKRKLRVIMTEE